MIAPTRIVHIHVVILIDWKTGNIMYVFKPFLKVVGSYIIIGIWAELDYETFANIT